MWPLLQEDRKVSFSRTVCGGGASTTAWLNAVATLGHRVMAVLWRRMSRGWGQGALRRGRKASVSVRFYQRQSPNQNHIKKETNEKWSSNYSVKIFTSLPGASPQAHGILPLTGKVPRVQDLRRHLTSESHKYPPLISPQSQSCSQVLSWLSKRRGANVDPEGFYLFQLGGKICFLLFHFGQKQKPHIIFFQSLMSSSVK